MNIVIRKATKSDMAAIHALVEELAIYEREPEAVITSVADYERDFLAKVFDSYVAEIEEKIVGMTLFYVAYSTWKGKMLYLEDFVVNQNYRQFGVGQLLFDAFLEEAKMLNATLVKWQVLDWNEPALKFYQKNKATIEKDWWNGKIFLNNFIV